MMYFSRRYCLIWYCLLPLVSKITLTLNNGLVKTPPMGWLSWEQFQCEIDCHKDDNNGQKKKLSNCISEDLFVQMADAMIERGYLAAGYDRINIDDCWMKAQREVTTGQLLPDPQRFPNGIKYLADYMHKRGLKLGIYQNLGRRTCMGFPGTLGFEDRDVRQFAEWGVDMIKLDACFTPTTSLDKGYIQFSRLIKESGRPMVFSCSWPYYQIFVSQVHLIPRWDLISMNCNLFRVYHDIKAEWKSILATIDFMGDYQQIFGRVSHPGSWPDPDMLLIGNPGLSVSQAQTQMAIWCILPAPLFMSNDVRRMEPEFETILLNRDAIEINQDPLALPGERLFHNATMDVWRRPLSQDRMALVVLNRHIRELAVEIPFEQVQTEQLSRYQKFRVLNIFSGEDYLISRAMNLTRINVQVEATGVTFLRLTPEKQIAT